MFDIGFWELMLIALVALLVFGPERLPRMVRETSLWIRRARMMVASAKTEIDRELQLYELRQSLEEKRRHFEKEVDAITIKPSSLSMTKRDDPGPGDVTSIAAVPKEPDTSG